MSVENLREELIQVAAVAVAIVEDLDLGSSQTDYEVVSIYDDIRAERSRQDMKWGPQHHDPLTWLAILAEEVGEAAREVEPDPKLGGAANAVLWHLRRAEERARLYFEEEFGW